MRFALFLSLLTLGCADPPTDDTDIDTVEPLAGQGEISGDCGEIDALEIDSNATFFFSNTLNFVSPFDEADLTDGGHEIIADGNLGGSSLWSEVFAYEMLYRCEGATLVKTESEITYQDGGGKKTDLLVEMDGFRVGVSVTRAFGWPPEDPYTIEQAIVLLEDKLGDVQISSANVTTQDAWTKQILHILAYTPDHADTVAQAFATLDPTVTADTLIVVTATEGDDEILY